MPASAPVQATVPVWSPALRLLHWTIAGTVIASFATHEGGGRAHEILGYVALAAAALRVALGFAGGPVDRRSPQVRMAAGAEFVVAQVVDQHDEEIGALRSGSLRGHGLGVGRGDGTRRKDTRPARA